MIKDCKFALIISKFSCISNKIPDDSSKLHEVIKNYKDLKV